jgi:hypothetical protein
MFADFRDLRAIFSRIARIGSRIGLEALDAGGQEALGQLGQAQRGLQQLARQLGCCGVRRRPDWSLRACVRGR